ncbi:Uncharacterised protein [uncultured Clostridium sp.]|nr:Uncharacterised protein [uncultured Clostridium sp.]
MLDMVVPGFAANETLLYSPELKFYSNKVKMDENLDTNIKGLHCLGDSSGWTRGNKKSRHRKVSGFFRFEIQPSMSSTVFILTGVVGLSFQSVRTAAILSTTSMPATTLPKAAYWPSR